MHWPDGTRIPPGNLLLMLALAAASWGLIYVAAVGLWPHRAIDPVVAVAAHAEPEASPLANQPDGSEVKSPRETGERLKRRTHRGPSVAMRVFRLATSLN